MADSPLTRRVVHEALEGGSQVGLRRASRLLVDVGNLPLAQGGQRPALFELGIQAPALDLLLAGHAHVMAQRTGSPFTPDDSCPSLWGSVLSAKWLPLYLRS